MADPLLARDPLVGIVLAAIGAIGIAGLVAIAVNRQDLTIAAAVAGGGLVGLIYSRMVLALYRWGRVAVRDEAVVYDPLRFGILVTIIALPLLLLVAAFAVGRLSLAPAREALLAQAASGALLGGFFLGAGLYYVRPPER